MDIQFYGANCIKVATKQATVVIDDTLKALGKKSVTKSDDIAVFTQAPPSDQPKARMCLTKPGEYEASAISFKGIPARSHIDESGTNNTMFKIIISDMRMLLLGHIHPDLSDEQLESIGTVDILFVPTGGNGYTLDPIGAARMIKKIDPKIIIPTHYEIKDVNYEVPQQPLEELLKVLSLEPTETTAKYKVKLGAALPEVQQLIVLEPQT